MTCCLVHSQYTVFTAPPAENKYTEIVRNHSARFFIEERIAEESVCSIKILSIFIYLAK